MTILEQIVQHKLTEVAERKARVPVKVLEESIYFHTPVVSLRKYLQRPDRLGVIAEFKRRSPSQGLINAYAKVEEVSIGYMQAGASALSILTDHHFFGGQPSDLTTARRFNYCPILRKDFVVDEYQLLEARAIGADAVLLIAACLSSAQINTFTRLAHNLGLEVLVEIHSRAELDQLSPEADLVGVNNRNLHDFSVNLATSLELAAELPPGMVKVSESGIEAPDAILALKRAGFQGFLIGSHFMRAADPALACRTFIQQVHKREDLYQGAIA